MHVSKYTIRGKKEKKNTFTVITPIDIDIPSTGPNIKKNYYIFFFLLFLLS